MKGGTDKELLLLDSIDAIENELNKLDEKVEEKTGELENKIDIVKREIKAEMPNLDKVLESVRGTQGPQGERGEKGDTIIGQEGKRGPQGLVGPRGPNGEEGEPGKDGKDGADGKDADPAAVLPFVEERLPMLGEKVRDALELLQGDERLDASAVKGLTDELKRLGGIIASTRTIIGGGKQLRITEFSFDGDGSTTTFGISKEPAAKGRAIWVYYQGQHIQRVSQWTLAGKTLTTLFTPDVGTVLDGFLINF